MDAVCEPCPPPAQHSSDAAASSNAAGATHMRNPRPRRWKSRLIQQKTLSGTITVRKWVSDDAPALGARRVPGDSAAYLCTLEGCGKAFADAASLRKHMHTHGEKQYVCQVEGCGKRFLDSSKLKRHSLTHTGARLPAPKDTFPGPDTARKGQSRVASGDRGVRRRPPCLTAALSAPRLQDRLSARVSRGEGGGGESLGKR